MSSHIDYNPLNCTECCCDTSKYIVVQRISCVSYPDETGDLPPCQIVGELTRRLENRGSKKKRRYVTWPDLTEDNFHPAQLGPWVQVSVPLRPVKTSTSNNLFQNKSTKAHHKQGQGKDRNKLLSVQCVLGVAVFIWDKSRFSVVTKPQNTSGNILHLQRRFNEGS